MEQLIIRDRVIGVNHPPYFIAEIGSNHNGDMSLAKKLIDAAIHSGADAVKFQSWSKTSLISKAEYARNTVYADTERHFGTLEEMVEKYQLTTDQHYELSEYCRRKGAIFISTPFSTNEVDLLCDIGVPFFKIASMDINNLKLLSYIGTKNKPVILSTGMSTLGEIERAIDTISASGTNQICLLHCISVYPPKFEDINLRNIKLLKEAFDLPVGFSDHSQGISIPIAAIALGACVIEKHFTLDHSLPGWDHWVSADPGEMSSLVTQGHQVYDALGRSNRKISLAEREKKVSFRRCIVSTRALPRGHIITHEDLDYKRPGSGINPDESKYVIGRTLKRDIGADDAIHWNDLV